MTPTPVPGFTCAWDDEKVQRIGDRVFPHCVTHNYPASQHGPCLGGIQDARTKQDGAA